MVNFADERDVTSRNKRHLLERLSWDMIKFSYAEKSLDNMHIQKTKFVDFCTVFGYKPFPTTEWLLVRYATYLSFKFTSQRSIKNYVNTICIINELSGYGVVKTGVHLKKCLTGIKRKLRHITRQPKPFSFKNLA